MANPTTTRYTTISIIKEIQFGIRVTVVKFKLGVFNFKLVIELWAMVEQWFLTQVILFAKLAKLVLLIQECVELLLVKFLSAYIVLVKFIGAKMITTIVAVEIIIALAKVMETKPEATVKVISFIAIKDFIEVVGFS